MSISSFINIYVLRNFVSVKRGLNKMALNRRLLNANVFILLLLVTVIIQSLRSYSFDGHSHLLMLKNEKYSKNYDSLFKIYSSEEFKNMPLSERCEAFFQQLMLRDNGWKFDDFDVSGHDDNYVTFDEFVQFKKRVEKDMILDQQTLLALEREFNERSPESVKVTDRIIDAVTTLRIFGKCYIENNNKNRFGSLLTDTKFLATQADSKKPSEKLLCRDTEARLFPWFTGLLPSFRRWDGQVSSSIPIMKNYDVKHDEDLKTSKSSKRSTKNNNNCFFSELQESINGKGIVISASDAQQNELMRLALLLRATGNTLPIQIMHKGDLSDNVQKKLIEQFRKEISINELPSTSLDSIIVSTLKFPPQEVWFVNVEQSINKKFEDHFQKYANKLLAYMFNSFDDIILIDTDTVPFVKLESILSFPAYQEKGAYFFQDRQLEGSNTQNQINYFKRLFPSKLDQHFFGIPLVTDFTLKNRFIGDLRNHFMESGVVAIKRSAHFTGMLMAVQLNFWQTTTSKIHGDKELFWLGLSTAGDEKYHFNALGAASVGELTPSNNKRFPQSSFDEVCSNHPGHISGYDNSTLLWMNSGFTFCKNTDAAQFDAGKVLFKDYDAEQLRKHYQSITRINAAIVPPPQEIDGKNENGDPDRGWSDAEKYCYAYTWCAYEGVGSTIDEVHAQGLLVKFDRQQSKWFEFLGLLWMNGLKD